MSPSTTIPTRQLSPDKLLATSGDWSMTRLVDMVLLLALKDRAKQVLFEPKKDDYRLTYRVDP
jgi:type II secretory ATPase GspE/PulE/Tfp pilus assembly ATPase PilB-like protein